MAHSMDIPSYILEGIDAASKRVSNKDRAVQPSFDALYAQGKLPLALAQSKLDLTDHGLGAYEDQNGVVWVLEDGYIYRVADEE